MPPKSSSLTPSNPVGSKTATAKSKNAKVKTPAKPKQPLPEPERLKRLFTSLCAQIDGGHLANAVKTCDKILRISPADADALQTKLFLLLQTEQYAEALALASEGSEDKYAYERAYTLYRLQREDEAKGIVEQLKNGEEERGVGHLEAQMAYRQGHYDEAIDLYQQLLDSAEPNSEEHSDILTNLQAAQTHATFISSGYLSAVDALPPSMAASLESNPPPAHPSTLPIASSSTIPANSATSGAKQSQQPEKKVRTRRVPKGVTPGVTPAPDPERWIKKRERSTFVQKKKRGGGGGSSGATQGVILEQMPGQLPATGTGGGGGTAGGGGGGGTKKKGKKK